MLLPVSVSDIGVTQSTHCYTTSRHVLRPLAFPCPISNIISIYFVRRKSKYAVLTEAPRCLIRLQAPERGQVESIRYFSFSPGPACLPLEPLSQGNSTECQPPLTGSGASSAHRRMFNVRSTRQIYPLFSESQQLKAFHNLPLPTTSANLYKFRSSTQTAGSCSKHLIYTSPICRQMAKDFFNWRNYQVTRTTNSRKRINSILIMACPFF